ncbi:MAG: sugar transferase [Bacteroidetes bacterium]|nr:sugar transferase [Bacteroidota bacterium]
MADFLTALVSLGVSYFLSAILFDVDPSRFPAVPILTPNLMVIAAVFCLAYVALFELHKAYSYQRFTSLASEYVLVVRVAFLSILINVLISYMAGYDLQLRRTFFALLFLITLLSYIVEKTLLFYVASFLRKKGRNRKRVILIGTGTRAKKFIEIVSSNFAWGLDIVGLLTGDEEKVGQEFYGVKVLDTFRNIERILKDANPEEVVVTISTRRFDQIRTVFEACEREGVQLRLNSDFFGEVTKNVRVDNVYGLNIISFDMVRISHVQLFFKRVIDIFGASIALLFFSPFMLVAVLGILISDGRPILYHWNVMGLNKKPVRSWKFRTMVRNADELKHSLEKQNEMDGPVFKIRDDPRITPFGRWLRKFSIDETPQLFSVLKGDLSLVGPRPAGPHELVRYESWHRRKLSIKPGLTCLWQINGRNHVKDFDEWVRLDLQYIDNWSVWLDLKILLKTIPAVISGKGAS